MKGDIYQFLYKRDKPVPLKILGVIVALFSVGGLATTPVFGIVMALGAAGLLAYQSGIEVDFKNRRYREITAFGGVGFGDWIPLPELKCVSVFKTNLVSTTYSRSNASVTTREPIIQVNLATAQNNRIRLYETENMDEAYPFAKELAGNLGLKVWDATMPQGHWI